MKAIKFTSNVIEGRLEQGVAKRISDTLATFEGKKVTLTLSSYVRTKSNKQTAMLFSLIYPHYLSAMLDVGDDSAIEYGKKNRIPKAIDSLHEILLAEFAGRDVVNIDTGDVIYLPSRVSKMNTIEFSVYVNSLISACLDRYGYTIPEPLDNGF